MTGRNPALAAVMGVALLVAGLVRGALVMTLIGAALLVVTGVRGLTGRRARP